MRREQAPSSPVGKGVTIHKKCKRGEADMKPLPNLLGYLAEALPHTGVPKKSNLSTPETTNNHNQRNTNQREQLRSWPSNGKYEHDYKTRNVHVKWLIIDKTCLERNLSTPKTHFYLLRSLIRGRTRKRATTGWFFERSWAAGQWLPKQNAKNKTSERIGT